MDIGVFLNPNPVLHGETLVDPHGREYKMVNEPFLEVELRNFPEGEYVVSIFSPVKAEKKIMVKSRRTSVYFLDQGFCNPELSRVHLNLKGKGVEKDEILPCRVHRLSGTVSTFDGKPASAYIWATRNIPVEHDIIVTTDSDGRFTLFYPEGRRLRVFVGDKTYGSTTLESWIMADELKRDVEINPHIGGKFELYELKVWNFDNIWNVFFLPAIVNATFPPEIHAGDVSIWIENQRAKIKSFTPHKVFYKGVKQDAYYPAYLVCAVLDKEQSDLCSPVKIRVIVDRPGEFTGEAWFIL